MTTTGVLTTLLALALAGCASPPKTTFVRADGQRLSSNPTFQKELEGDLVGCRDQARPSMLSGLFDSSGRGDPCMEEKGYIEVPQEQAEAKRAEILAKKDQERIANLPPLPEKTSAPVVRRRSVRPAANLKKPAVSQGTRPAAPKPKKPPLANPLKLPEWLAFIMIETLRSLLAKTHYPDLALAMIAGSIANALTACIRMVMEWKTYL
jgi:hypothetical protein